MPASKGVEITLDRKRTLRYTMRAYEHIEAATGRNTLAEGWFEGLAAKDWVDVIHAGLLHEDPEVPRDVVLDNVDIIGIGEIVAAVAKALGGDEPAKNGSGKAKAATED